MAGLNAIERGEGRPLVLLHGIGSSCSAWEPVLDRLASAGRHAIAYDLPGFGRSPALPRDVEPTPLALGAAVLEDLRGRGVETPVDFAGNSLGGRVALELARRGHALAAVALAPSGLWRERPPRSFRTTLLANHLAARRLGGLSRALMRSPVARTLALASVGPARGWRMPKEAALEAITSFARADAFRAVLDGAITPPFRSGEEISVPVTVAFGTRDLLLHRFGARYRANLPPQTRWITLRGVGHVPMWDDPDAVARVILDGTR